MDLVIDSLESLPGDHDVEIVERKGLGHPDTLCDAIAERICVRLCRCYLDRFGTILHHNVDKVLLCGGSSRPSFGGGEILEPMEIYLAGRATEEYRGVRIPVHEIAVTACRDVLTQRLPAVDVDRHVRIIPRIRSGSTDLTRLFGRGRGVPLANDTSCATGFAPLTDLERVVLEVERRMTSVETRRDAPRHRQRRQGHGCPTGRSHHVDDRLCVRGAPRREHRRVRAEQRGCASARPERGPHRVPRSTWTRRSTPPTTSPPATFSSR